MKKITFIIFACLTITVSAQLQNLEGRWFSVNTEKVGTGWCTRDFKFYQNKWVLTFTMYADSAKYFPLFAFDTEGTFVIGKKSNLPVTTFESDFSFNKKFITLLTDDQTTLLQLGFDKCNLIKGNKTDISESGCSFFASVKNYPKEFDLTSLQGDKLFLGNRPADGNMGSADKRPKSLGYPLERFNESKHLKVNINPIQPLLKGGQCLAFIEVTVSNQDNFVKYVIGHLPSISQYGGKIIFEGTEKVNYEGANTNYSFLIIQQWNSKTQFEQWWNSPEYKPWKEMRKTGADIDLKLVTQRN